MRKIGKYRRKKQKKIIIITSLSLLLFLCVGYAAYNTTLSLKAKGNIKQKGITSEDLKENVVESGDGLYKDIYEDGRYIYKGENPNNYITFNDETWRIISIEADGTIKITSTNTKQFLWDTSLGYYEGTNHGSNNWARPADVNTYLNGEYLNSIKNNNNKIVNHTWYIGEIEENNSNISKQITDEKSTTWNGNIGLITLSEYLRANTNTEQCGNYNLYNNNASTCDQTNWMTMLCYLNLTTPYGIWTITPYNTDDVDGGYVESIHIEAGIYGVNPGAQDWLISPSLYLSSDTTLSGSGTEQDPYTITN